MRLRRTYILLVFFLSASYGYGQSVDSELNHISVEQYENLKKEIDFTKTKRALKPRNEAKEKKEAEPKAPGINLSSWFGSLAIIQWIAYLLIAALAVFILYLVFSNIKIEDKVDAEKDFKNLDIEDIEEIDPDAALNAALANGDYRTAIRMKFIKLLQLLVKKKVIKWTPEKTNRDYRREIKDSSFRSEFGQLASIYENVWFGNLSVSKDDYQELAVFFDQCLNSAAHEK